MNSWLDTLPANFRRETLGGDGDGIVLLHAPVEWSDGDGMTLIWDPAADMLHDGGETAFRLWALGDAADDACAAYALPPVQHTAWGLSVPHPTSVESVAALVFAMQAADRWPTEQQGA